MATDNLEATLLAVFEDMRGHAKAEVLHKLAKATIGGDILEIGSHHGFGTIALALGTGAGYRLPVYAVDYNRPTIVWTTETLYSQQDRFVFFRNLIDVGLCADVNVVNLPMSRAARAWDAGSVGLLFWDPGLTVEGLVIDVLDAWATKIAPEGILAINDTEAGDLAVDRYIENNLDEATWKRLRTRAGVRIVRRR